ncbi:MAG: hypothetical protein RhofKO_26680 [Rhodothermales bacterium]
MFRRLLLVCLLPLGLLVLGCEENLAERDLFEAPFTLYGVLSPQLDTQAVRVYPIEDFPTLGTAEPLGATLTSTDLATGEVRTWRDSVLQAPNGQIEHVYWSRFRPAYDTAYRIDIIRDADGAHSHATVHVPPRVHMRLLTPDSLKQRILIETGDFRALTPRVEYTVGWGEFASDPVLRYFVNYAGLEIKAREGWVVDVNFGPERRRIENWYLADTGSPPPPRPCPYVGLLDFSLHVIVGDSVWNPPGGLFDANVVSEPNTLTNIANGFGFIGAGYTLETHLRPSRKAVEDACYYYVWDE